jgi:hypothetical protein
MSDPEQLEQVKELITIALAGELATVNRELGALKAERDQLVKRLEDCQSRLIEIRGLANEWHDGA